MDWVLCILVAIVFCMLGWFLFLTMGAMYYKRERERKEAGRIMECLGVNYDDK